MAVAVMGVYLIRNTVTGKVYVGSSVNVKQRWAHHKWQLNSGRSNCRRLQATWAKHGEGAFSFEIAEVVDNIGDLISREQYWLDQTGASESGYNSRPQAEGWRGQPRSKAWRDAIGAAHKGRKNGPPSPEHRAKLSAALKAYIATCPERRGAAAAQMMSERSKKYWASLSPADRAMKCEAMSVQRKGKKAGPRSLEAKENMGAAQRLAWAEGRNRGSTGRKPTEDENRRRSAKLLEGYASGRLSARPCTPELREKRRQASTGRQHSAETRAKMSRAQKGRKVSEEHRQKLSASIAAHWAGLTDEQREAHAAKCKSRVTSQETKAKLKRAMTGRTYSPETIERMRAAAHKREQAKRESRS